ncbi:MAG TPA: four helix bundle protein [Bacteroidales bacterium]|nr:four helix bundle protein [Bacteroidales bacterium]HPT09632.1 four helix bundle protein [Bacteroidales bacterium]
MENEHERPATFFRFEDLRIYHKALDYVEWVYQVAKNMAGDPLAKTFFDRFLISANGIALNIAEGSSRNKSQFVYYLKMAKSSVRECVVLSTIARNHSFISAAAFDDSKNHLMEMTKMIGALIGSLQRSVKPGESEEEEEDI